MRLFLSFLAIVPAISFMAGCTSTRSSNTARTSTEQMLISNSIDQSLDKIDFAPFAGETVYVDDKYVDCVDSKYLISSVRHRIIRSGAMLVAKPEDARVIVELRNGAVGTELAESFIGVPEIVLPGMLTLPEVRFVSRTRQQGVAKIGLVAIDTQTRQILGDGGLSTAVADSNNWYVVGMGPIQNGSVRSEMGRSLAQRAPMHVTPMPQNVAFNSPPLSYQLDEPYRLTSQQTGANAPARVSLEPASLQTAPLPASE